MTLLSATNRIFIYEISDGAVYDWIAAASLADARAGFSETYGPEHLAETESAGDGFRVLTIDETKRLQFRLDEPEGDDDETTISFAAQLQRMIDAGQKFPTHFACSEN